jgi:hypothetical protein
MIPEEAKKLFKTKYESFGCDKFYQFLLNYASNKVAEKEEVSKKPKAKMKDDANKISPEIELMDYSDRFLDLFRGEGEITYLDIARLFRRAGHKVYRIMLKKNMVKKNSRFLNVVE